MAQLDHGLDLEFPFGPKLAGSRSLTVEDRRLIFPAKTLVRSSAFILSRRRLPDPHGWEAENAGKVAVAAGEGHSNPSQ